MASRRPGGPRGPGRLAGSADVLAFAVPLAAVFLYGLARSLGWQMRHDLPMMMYQAFLVDHFGLLPWRDFFDMNLPGTYATYLFIGRVFGYSDLSMRLADLAWMAGLAGTTALLLRGLPRRVWVVGLLLFLVGYLEKGGQLTLQREYLALVPVTLGAGVASLTWGLRTRALLSGLAFGVAATYKPHLLVGLVPVVAFLAAEGRRERGSWRAAWPVLGASAVGVALPLLVVLAGLVALGLLDDFVQTARYLPLYGRLDGEHVALAGQERLLYILRELARLGGRKVEILGAGLGVFVALTLAGLEGPARRKVGLLGGLLAAYLLYPAFTGQFWTYHWLPALYFAALCAALLLLPLEAGVPRGIRVIALSVLAVVAVKLSGATDGFARFDAGAERSAAKGRPERIAEWLDAHLQPGETVQPDDWVIGGVAHALLLAEARPATRFLYTFHFYHHVSTPYIQGLRAELMEELAASRPAFVVSASTARPFVTGPDTTEDFPAFDRWLLDGYEPVRWGEEYTIWERKDRLAARAPWYPFFPPPEDWEPVDPAGQSFLDRIRARVGGLH